MEPRDLSGIMQILCISRIQGPSAAPLRMKDIQEIEFQAFHSLLHLPEPLYIVEPSKIMNFKLFKLKNRVSRTQNLELKFNVQNSDICMQLILKLSILDACMHWKHTCVYRNM